MSVKVAIMAGLFSAAGVCGGGYAAENAAPPPPLDLSKVRHGIVCFTFDDGQYPSWLAHREVFKKYRARATFFYSDRITPEAIESMKTLRADGHSIGFHGVAHRNAPQSIAEMGADKYFSEEIMPQIEAAKHAGVEVRHFAYPNNLHDEASDRLLADRFRHFRAGLFPRPAAGKGYWIAGEPQGFYPLEKIAETPVLGGSGIGQYYLSEMKNLNAALEKAAAENKLIVFFSHKIEPGATSVNMPSEILEACLRKADSLKMEIAGFDELP